MFRDELRHRLRRIVGGDRRHDDVDRILLSLRDKSGDRESIRELRDFTRTGSNARKAYRPPRKRW